MFNRHVEITREEKIAQASDYYKAVFGFRPRGREHWSVDDDEAVAAWNRAHEHMQAMKATPEGREALRLDGWVLGDE